MTVKELIEFLSNFGDNVTVCTTSYNMDKPLESVIDTGDSNYNGSPIAVLYTGRSISKISMELRK